MSHRWIKWALYGALVIHLAGCSWIRPDPEVITKEVPVECPEPPMPPSLRLRDIEWFDCDGYACLTIDDYRNLGRNTSDIIAWMKDARSVIDYYQRCNDV